MTDFPRGVHVGPCEDPLYHLIDQRGPFTATYCGRRPDNGMRWCWCGIGDWSGRLCKVCALARYVEERDAA